MNIFYLYSQPRSNWEKQVKAGRMPDHVLYGLNWLRQFGHHVGYSDAAFSQFNLLKWLVSPLQRWFLHHHGVGFQLDQALLLLPQLRQADFIVTTNDSCGLPVAFLKWLGLLKTPQVYYHIGFNRSSKFLKKLIKQPKVLIDFKTTPPGVDIKFFHPKKVKFKYDIVSVGRDIGRDYMTLFQAIKDLPIKVKVICDPKNLIGLNIPANVSIDYSVSYLKVRQAYRGSKMVIIPTKKNTVSGQISLLEALACGKPVIAAQTPALNIAPVIFYQPQNAAQLKFKIQQLLKNPLRQFSSSMSHFSSKNFASQIISEIHPITNKLR